MSELELLRKLIRIDTTNPPGNEGAAIELLEARLLADGITSRTFTSSAGRHNLVGRLEGPKDAPALVLLSHVDVVAVEVDRWSRDPFGGEIADGAVWGRGVLDMKGVVAMHVGAFLALARTQAALRREVILVVVADEEAGGHEGAAWLHAAHPEAVGLGDGRPSPEVLGEGGFGLSGIAARPVMPVVLGEKTTLWVELTARGEAGHGSLPPADRAPTNLLRALNDVPDRLAPRVHPVMQAQFRRLAAAERGPKAAALRALSSARGNIVARLLGGALGRMSGIGPLTADTLTLTRLDAGYKHNVVPAEARAALDCRLLPDADPSKVVADLRRRAARHGVEVEERSSQRAPVSTPGPLMSVLEEASRTMPGNPVVVPSLSPGMSDVRFWRSAGATGYGWVPVILSRELLATIHSHDERMPVDAYETGERVMTEVVRRAAVA